MLTRHVCFIHLSCLVFFCSKTSWACRTMSQDLIEAAEPWRQNEFSKKDLKNELWLKLVPFIQNSEVLQTTESVVKSGSKASTQKSTASSSSMPWNPDDMSQHIADILDKRTDDIIVAAEKYVDETLGSLIHRWRVSGRSG